MRVFVTGGTGYIGSAVVEALEKEGHETIGLVRKGSARRGPLARRGMRTVEGDLLAPETYRSALAEADAVIHLVGIIREAPSRDLTFDRVHVEGTRALVDACVAAGFAEAGKRFVHMSALGARPAATTAYFRTKWAAEELLRNSGLTHVIFRPSVVFGPDDAFVNMLAGLVRAPLTPVIGDGRYRMQPVSLRTVADVFVKALTYDPVDVAFDVGGPEQLPYNDMLREIGDALQRRVRLAHVPLALMKPVVAAMERFPFFPITTNQLTMLLEENICRSGTPFYDAYGTPPIRFADGIREYLRT
ncbi:complex I NDUFA9 subunit family protein [Paenibacillus sp.]|uniref:complex I NDUFA9 subunit family protein n=1 Tax=Paenibacillus sp. TaxID=58172 RepID=UPI002D4312D2|nr:complex I NDUFA9 subunit family protein [Paenibacillus sp.]HZG55301.1 complex I NDUFA9 subunit family protein [Paenibacillus sp.]